MCKPDLWLDSSRNNNQSEAMLEFPCLTHGGLVMPFGETDLGQLLWILTWMFFAIWLNCMLMDYMPIVTLGPFH